jgi:NAD-dependent dihydropyrimidine dehydrogenase PreA subunit
VISNNQVYIELQKHLNKQPVGFPATRSRAEIKILKYIFTPYEARIATFLSYKPEPLEIIWSRLRHLVDSAQALEQHLEHIQKKGGIETKIRDGTKLYCNAPLVVGMFELQLGRLTPEFIKDYNKYTSDRKFGIEFLSTELPQMRTIPVAKSIQPQHHASTFDEVTTLLQQADEPFVIIECICRKKKSMEGKACKITDRKETCLAIGSMAQTVLLSGNGREISREETLSIIEKNQDQGLVLQPSNTARAEFICSCCGCCCGMLGIHKSLPKPLEFWAANFQAAVDPDTCIGCGACADRCQVDAVSVSEKNEQAVVDRNRCLGCGVCISDCPTSSITLVKKSTEVKPPQTREDLYDIIMANKKGPREKLKLTGKLIGDAIRSKQIKILKS